MSSHSLNQEYTLNLIYLELLENDYPKFNFKSHSNGKHFTFSLAKRKILHTCKINRDAADDDGDDGEQCEICWDEGISAMK